MKEKIKEKVKDKPKNEIERKNEEKFTRMKDGKKEYQEYRRENRFNVKDMFDKYKNSKREDYDRIDNEFADYIEGQMSKLPKNVDKTPLKKIVNKLRKHGDVDDDLLNWADKNNLDLVSYDGWRTNTPPGWKEW